MTRYRVAYGGMLLSAKVKGLPFELYICKDNKDYKQEAHWSHRSHEK